MICRIDQARTRVHVRYDSRMPARREGEQREGTEVDFAGLDPYVSRNNSACVVKMP